MSKPYDRPAKTPGGCECECCGVIFVGEEWHILCALCDDERVFSVPVEPPAFRGVPPAREWISAGKCSHQGRVA